MKDIRIKAVMAHPVVTVQIHDSFKTVEEKFNLKGIRHLPVVDSDQRIMGLMTQRDLFRICPPRISEEGYAYDPTRLDEFILKHVMKKNPFTLGPDDSFARAVEVMAENKYGCIPIVDRDQKVVGILTETDVLKFAARCLLS